jgi:hypothetical protein
VGISNPEVLFIVVVFHSGLIIRLQRAEWVGRLEVEVGIMRFSIILFVLLFVATNALGQRSVGTFNGGAVRGIVPSNQFTEKKLRYPKFYRDEIDGEIYTAREGAVQVVQIIDEENLIVDVRRGSKSHVLWIEGYPTKDLSDGDDFRVDLDLPFKVNGSKKYETAIGSTKTIPLLAVFDEKKIEREAKKAKEEATKKKLDKQAEEDNAKWRTWKDASGSFEIEAKFSGVTNNVVKLKKKNDKTVSIPLEQLSEPDRKWIDSRKK